MKIDLKELEEKRREEGAKPEGALEVHRAAGGMAETHAECGLVKAAGGVYRFGARERAAIRKEERTRERCLVPGR